MRRRLIEYLQNRALKRGEPVCRQPDWLSNESLLSLPDLSKYSNGIWGNRKEYKYDDWNQRCSQGCTHFDFEKNKISDKTSYTPGFNTLKHLRLASNSDFYFDFEIIVELVLYPRRNESCEGEYRVKIGLQTSSESKFHLIPVA